MRIVFVGMNNKPGMQPLDSKTRSGKLIDRVIAELQHKLKLFESDFLKTNLYDSTEWPKDFSQSDCMEWWVRVNAEPTDIIITLGESVYLRFKKLNPIKLGHPSSVWSHENQKLYIKRAVAAVRNQLTKSKISNGI